MGDTVRTTRECALQSLPSDIVDAMQRRMTADDATILICCETISTTVKKGMFRRRQVSTTTGVMVTPRHLIWATSEPGRDAVVMSALLRDLEVHDYESSDHFQLIPDSGVTIDGLRTDVPGHVGSAFIGVGPEAAGGRFRRTLRQAIADSHLVP